MDQILIVVASVFAIAFALSCLVLVFVTPHEVSDILTKVSNIEVIAYRLVEQNKQLAEQNKQLAELNDMMSKRLFDIENIVDAICDKDDMMSKRLFDIENIVDAICDKEAA